VRTSQDWSDDLGGLRAFAQALVVEDDDAYGANLAARLVRQATFARLAWPGGGALSPKARMFHEFVALYRRHVRKAERDERERPRTEIRPEQPRQDNVTARGVRRLPLDLREALLLVALSGFAHAEGAQILEISLPQMIERLRDARARLARALAGDNAPAFRRTPHLRLVK
jgi:predicted DNA-binding protein (UPF0251 family)